MFFLIGVGRFWWAGRGAIAIVVLHVLRLKRSMTDMGLPISLNFTDQPVSRDPEFTLTSRMKCFPNRAQNNLFFR